MEKKLAVAACYEHKKQLCGGRPNLSEIADEHQVSRKFVTKMEAELHKSDGRVVFPEEVTSEMVGQRALGSGSIALDEGDCFALICLMRTKWMRSLGSYGSELYCLRGTKVSKMTISCFFNHALPIRAGLCVPNLVQYNKFCPRNVEKAIEYIRALERIDLNRLK